MSLDQSRLAILLPDLTLGGAERSMIKLARGLEERGLQVDLVLCRAQGEFLNEVPSTVQIVDLQVNHVRNSVPALIYYLKNEQPTVLLACMHANIPAIIAHLVAGNSTRLFISERNTPSCEAKYHHDLRMKVIPILDRIFYRWVQGIIAVSQGVAHELISELHIPETLVKVINNPIITPEFRLKTKAPLDHPWFQGRQPPVLVAVGRLVKQKDFTTLIMAFSHVRQTRTARLLILGEGEERPELEALSHSLNLSQDISMPGFVENPYPFMVQATGFILSSRWEGLPGVLIEALYCGRPIIATRCPHGPDEILDKGQYGRLVPVGDIQAMTEAIHDLLDGKIQAPPEESWQRYELENILDQYIHTLFEKK